MTSEPEALRLTFVTPAEPKSENWARGRAWSAVRRYTQPWRDAAWASTRNAMIRRQVPWMDVHPNQRPWSPRPVTIHLTIPFRTIRGRDPHNYVGTVVKAAVDGVVRAGLVSDDTPKWVTVLEPTLTVLGPTERPDAILTITPRSTT